MAEKLLMIVFSKKFLRIFFCYDYSIPNQNFSNLLQTLKDFPSILQQRYIYIVFAGNTTLFVDNL